MNRDQAPTIPQWTTRQVVSATLLVLAVVIAFWILYRFSWVVFILFVAVVLGTAIRPAVNWLNQRGVKRTRAVLLIYIALLLLFVLFVSLSAPMIANQVQRFPEASPAIMACCAILWLSRQA
jgi:predicted PurR-regulated permease PerM